MEKYGYKFTVGKRHIKYHFPFGVAVGKSSSRIVEMIGYRSAWCWEHSDGKVEVHPCLVIHGHYNKEGRSGRDEVRCDDDDEVHFTILDHSNNLHRCKTLIDAVDKAMMLIIDDFNENRGLWELASAKENYE